MKEFCHGKTIALVAYCVLKLNTKRAGGNSFGNLLFGIYNQNHRRQLLKIMQLIVILLLGAFLQVNANVYAQATVTLSEKNVPLEKIIKSIERQTGYVFMYESKLTQVLKRVTIEVKDATIAQVLDICFKDQPISYNIVDKTIIVKRRDLQQSNEPTTQKKNAIDVKGRIVDKNGDPISGATVRADGSTKSTITDSNGEFTLTDIIENSKITISCIGYETATIMLNGRKVVNATLQIKISALDETVVIAYGTTTRRFSTGNISTVKSEDISKQPVQNPILALQGRVPGIVITQNTGVANGAITVRIQGQNSIRSGNDPLYVVDGVPYLSRLQSIGFDGPLGAGTGTSGSPLSFINPLDIESIDVLKDADATAIYGSRAANGAILITTKKGKTDKTKIDFNIQHGFGKVLRKVKMLTSRQYLDMRYEAFENDGIDWKSPMVTANDLKVWDTTQYTNWQDELIGGYAKYSTINSTISGGSNQVQYLISGNYHRETTVFPGESKNQKGSLHFNFGSFATKKFQFQLSGTYLIDKNVLPNTDLTQNALWLEPIAPKLINDDGSLNWQLDRNNSSTWYNPMIYTTLKLFEGTTTNLITNLSLKYRILPGLELSGNLGYTNLNSTTFAPTPQPSIQPEYRSQIPRSSLFGYRQYRSWITEPQLVYQRQLGKLKTNFLVGGTLQWNGSDILTQSGSGYSSDLLLKNISSATSIAASTNNFEYKYNGIFGRAMLNWNDKFLFNWGIRRDGSSRFGDKNKFHTFTSFGAGYIFSNEKFVIESLKFISFGKFKASYGITGSDQTTDYNYLSLYGNVPATIPYQNVVGLQTTGIPNPYLQWEETKKINFGIDLGFLKDRILISGNFSKNSSSNQLLAYSLPSTTGFPSITSNFPAIVKNETWEFQLNTINVKSKSFSWSTNLNLTIPKNYLSSFPNLSSSTYASMLNIGKPLSSANVFKYAGVNQDNGLYEVFDKNGIPTNNPDFTTDRTEIVNTDPKFYGGFQNTIRYKGFEIELLFQAVRQMGITSFYYSNDNTNPGNFFPAYSNQPITVIDRWRKPGDKTRVAFYTTGSNVSNWTPLTDVGYTYKASFIRLKNISLSWQIPKRYLERVLMNTGRIYFQGQNILTITQYPGLDPENQSNRALPPLSTLTIGAQFSF